MNLENIIEVYGWNDYLDMNTGYIYKLSKAEDIGCGMSKVPVTGCNGLLIGYTKVNKVREETR